MKLGIADTCASAKDIEAGCAAALALMTARNVTPEAAYKAVMSRSNRERRFDRHAARAWDDAEGILRSLGASTVSDADDEVITATT